MIANITSSALAASALTGKTSVLNLRVSDAVKQTIAEEAIRDGRSMNAIAERAIILGLTQMLAPTPVAAVEVVEAPKAKAKGKRKGDDGAAPAAPIKPRKK